MPKKVAHNCFQCSKLSNDEAQLKSCWDADRCPNRRHYQRNKERISQQRRSLKTQAQRSDHAEQPATTTIASGTTIAIDHPIGTAASIIFYRERQDAPVHAIAAEIWQDNRKVLNVKPMHCLGLSPSQVVGMMADILKACSIELNVELTKFASKVELHPSLCPIRPCPSCERNPNTTNTNN
jgi:prolyl-tRNA synthetase